jgi:hypothetical protein
VQGRGGRGVALSVQSESMGPVFRRDGLDSKVEVYGYTSVQLNML